MERKEIERYNRRKIAAKKKEELVQKMTKNGQNEKEKIENWVKVKQKYWREYRVKNYEENDWKNEDYWVKIGHLDQKGETGDQILRKNDHIVDRNDQIPPMEKSGLLNQKGDNTDQISVEKSGQIPPGVATSDCEK